jgi:hypothetical protein
MVTRDVGDGTRHEGEMRSIVGIVIADWTGT